MQDIMQRLGVPAEDHSPFDHNTAAITLAMAMNKARLELADRDGMKADTKTFAVARLQALRKALEPLYAAIPPEVELFDLGLVAQERPRLFVDILAYVEMNRGQSGFRLMQDTRGGRILLAETGDERAMIDEITTYVARRLVDRERRLAAEEALPHAAPEFAVEPHAEIPRQEPVEPEPSELARRAMPAAMPMTAAEAFRQWTGHPPASMMGKPSAEMAKDISSAVSASAPAPAADAPEADQDEAKEEAAGKKTGEAETRSPPRAETAELPSPAVNGPDHVEQPPVLALQPAAPVPLTPAPAAKPATPPMPPKSASGSARLPDRTPLVRRESSGRWLGPLLALLIGAGLGAAALYLYAASLVR